MKFMRLFVVALVFQATMSRAFAQAPTTCALIGTRANSNGQANQCPNNGGAMATNFVGTPYATIPAGSKTADINFRYANATTSLLPYAITKIFVTTNGVTTQLSSSAGPAGPPVASGQDVLVKYCVYGSANLPVAGTISFQFTNVQTGVAAGTCSFDAACTANCVVANNPVALPLTFSAFNIKETNNSVFLQWTTDADASAKGFEIEKSNDGVSYVKAGYVAYTAPSAGLTSTFSFTDTGADETPMTYYRIKVVNVDNQYYYTDVRKFQRKSPGSNIVISVAGGSPVISQVSNRSKLTVSLRNSQGVLLQQVDFSGATTRLRQLSSGVYYVTVRNGSSPVTTKAITIAR